MKGWLDAFEGALFEEEEEGLEERYRAAAEFAARRKDTGWRLTHDELYDVRVESGLSFDASSEVHAGGGGCTQLVHGRSHMTIDPRIPTVPGRGTSSFHQPGRGGRGEAWL